MASAPVAKMSFDYLAEDDVRGRNMEMLGAKIVRIRHYRLRIGTVEVVRGFYLDADGRVAFIGND